MIIRSRGLPSPSQEGICGLDTVALRVISLARYETPKKVETDYFFSSRSSFSSRACRINSEIFLVRRLMRRIKLAVILT